MPGTDTSAAEVTHVSSRGIWVLVDDRELFLGYDQFPWFLEAPIASILAVERATPDRLRWPALDIDLTIASIEHPERFPLIARDAEDRMATGPEACEFLKRFARFEFALKLAHYVECKTKADPRPVVLWDRFAQDHEAQFEFDPELQARVEPILRRPPAQQVVDATKSLRWHEEEPPEQVTFRWLLKMTYRIRNNLFHGGKNPWNPERDVPLLKAGTAVLDRAVHLNPEVKARYFSLRSV